MSSFFLPLSISLSLYLSMCLFPSQVQTPDKSVSPLCLSLSFFLLALWVVAPPHPGCPTLTLIALLPSHLPIQPPTQQGPGLALPHSAITIAHMYQIWGGAAPTAHPSMRF